jgi:hypothetical protein
MASCKYIDDRTPEQRKTHVWAVVAYDKFMSGWGEAKNGTSRCAWAVPDEFVRDGRMDRLEAWVRNRSDMRYVNVTKLDTYRVPRGTAHFHVYVVGENHPAVS